MTDTSNSAPQAAPLASAPASQAPAPAQTPAPSPAPAASMPSIGAAAHLVGADAAGLASALGQLLGATEAKAKQEIHDHIDEVLEGLATLEASLKSHVTSSTSSLSGVLAGKASHLVTAGLFFLIGAGAVASAAALFLGLKSWLG